VQTLTTYFALRERSEFHYKEKCSEFIGLAYPAASAEECGELMNAVRKTYYDATHHTYGYLLCDGTRKASDAGEPSGTAGMRIINAIEHFQLRNTLCVVVRYFGGTKLGVGPLGKAYYHCAFSTLENAVRQCYKLHVPASLSIPYEKISAAYRVFSLFPVKVLKTDFAAQTMFTLLVPFEEIDAVKSELDRLIEGKHVLSFDQGKGVFEPSK
jgi:putative IMPACT (imprinted ancient) family translation regulator